MDTLHAESTRINTASIELVHVIMGLSIPVVSQNLSRVETHKSDITGKMLFGVTPYYVQLGGKYDGFFILMATAGVMLYLRTDRGEALEPLVEDFEDDEMLVAFLHSDGAKIVKWNQQSITEQMQQIRSHLTIA